MDCSLPGSSLHGILQARILERLPFPSPGDLPDPGIEPRSPALEADALTSEPPGKPWDISINVILKDMFYDVWVLKTNRQSSGNMLITWDAAM